MPLIGAAAGVSGIRWLVMQIQITRVCEPGRYRNVRWGRGLYVGGAELSDFMRPETRVEQFSPGS